MTAIAADGQVVADSAADGPDFRSLENYRALLEVRRALDGTTGVSARYDPIAGTETLYVATPVRHPAIAAVRLALPLSDVTLLVNAIHRAAMFAFLVLVVLSLLVAWGGASLLSARVRAIASSARRYESGDFSVRGGDYGNDEIADIAKSFDATSQAVGRRLAEMGRAGARLEAILGSMNEGVVVVDSRGQLQLVNRSARELLALPHLATGRHYLE